ncbi:MAG: DUF3368 domain-containing protein [Hyphomicrobium sp.]|uniref:DUF3368 domain-containing protein n=1 Tax=Hyphomicrobium sp. TaxID=82 RepID=UPI003D148F17
MAPHRRRRGAPHRRPRRLEVHGSLGVLLWAAAQRHLDHAQADAALTSLAQSSLWLSPAVLAEARAALRTLGAPP